MIIDLVGITGIADCASTASIMAGSKPDEVIERANKNMIDKTGPIDVAAEIRKAEEEIEQEKEAARKAFADAQEKRRLAIAEQEERKRREREEMAKRARLDADVRYTERQVKSGGGGSVKVKQAAPDLATEGQQKYLWVLGMRGDLSQYSKKQAGRMISQLKGGATVAEVARTNPVRGEAKQPAPEKPSAVPALKKAMSLDEINALLMMR